MPELPLLELYLSTLISIWLAGRKSKQFESGQKHSQAYKGKIATKLWAMYECEYWHQRRNGWWTIRTMECEYGCCGDMDNQECCAATILETEKDSHLWQTVSAITAGLFVLSLFIMMVICAVKKKNVSRARVIGREVPYRSRPETFSGVVPTTSPPPYTSSTQYNVFLLGNSTEQNVPALEPSASGGMTEPPPTYSEQSPHPAAAPPPSYSSST